MKKLLLAPAVALVFTGLVAAPVAAVETSVEQQTEQAQAPAKISADKADETADKAETPAEKPAPAKKPAAKPAPPAAPEEDPAPPEEDPAEPSSSATNDSASNAEGGDGNNESGTEGDTSAEAEAESNSLGDSTTETDADADASTDPAAETDADAASDPEAEAESDSDSDSTDEDGPGDPVVNLETPEISAEDFVNTGVSVSVSNLLKTDKVTETLNNRTSSPFDDGGTVYQITYPGEAEKLKVGDTVDFAIQVEREGTQIVNHEVSVTIVEEEAAPLEVSLEVIPEKITAEDLSDENKGMMIRVHGVETGDTVADSLTGETEDVTEDGTYSKNIFYAGDPEDLEPGPVPFTVTVTRGEEEVVLEGSIEIVEDDGEQDAYLQVAHNRIGISELEEWGLAYSGTGYTPNSEAVAVAVPNDSEQEIYFEEITVADDGTVEGDIVPNTEYDVDLGDYTLYVMDPENFAEAAFAVVADEAPDASLSISPKVIEADDFVNTKKGVTLTVKNCYPGSAVGFTVTAKNSNITAYENIVTVDEKGSASVTVYGTTNNPMAYVGEYDVTASCEDIDLMEGSFEVIAGAAGGGGAGGGGSDLPRTGGDLTGLGTGALLLLVGGAAVAITARRKSQGQL